MSIGASRTRLAKTTKQLMNEWELTKPHWNDTKSKEFEATYLKTLPDMITSVGTIMEDLDKILAKIRKSCD